MRYIFLALLSIALVVFGLYAMAAFLFFGLGWVARKLGR